MEQIRSAMVRSANDVPSQKRPEFRTRTAQEAGGYVKNAQRATGDWRPSRRRDLEVAVLAGTSKRRPQTHTSTVPHSSIIAISTLKAIASSRSARRSTDSIRL